MDLPGRVDLPYNSCRRQGLKYTYSALHNTPPKLPSLIQGKTSPAVRVRDDLDTNLTTIPKGYGSDMWRQPWINDEGSVRAKAGVVATVTSFGGGCHGQVPYRRQV